MRIRNIPLLIIASMILTPLFAFSNMGMGMMAGTGMWGGMQQCPYPGGGRVVDERQEEIRRLEELLEDKEYALEELEDDIADLEHSLEDIEDNLGNYIRASELAMVLGHISGGATCDEYDYGTGGGSSGGGGQSTKSEAYEDREVFDGGDSDYGSNRGGYVSDSYGGIPIEGMSAQDWRQACDPTGRGQVNEQFVCARFYIRGARRSSSCVRDLSQLSKLYEMLNEKRDLIYEIERDISELERKIDRESSRRSRRRTEGDCAECYERGESRSRKGVDWAGVTGAVINGLVGAYGVYTDKQKFESARINNAELGYPTMASSGYGAPYLYAGMYGLANGLSGGGSFGCGSSMYPGSMNPMGMPNVFGYPNGMYGPQGGMYGPFGHYPGGMMPGMMMGGMMPGMMSGSMSPYGMMAGGGFMMSGGMMSPYGGGGYMSPYGAMSGGMMPGMMTGSGMMMSGGMMSPYGGGGYMSPYGAMSGGMMPGMMAGGGMMSGMMAGGGMMPGMMAGGGMMSGMMAGGGMMSGMMAGGGMMASGGGNMQLQQQMMNLYMQQQQRYQEDMMARQRTLSGLEQELQTLMTRYQQAAYGMGSTGGYNYGGGSSVGINPVGGGATGGPTVPGVAPSVR